MHRRKGALFKLRFPQVALTIAAGRHDDVDTGMETHAVHRSLVARIGEHTNAAVNTPQTSCLVCKCHREVMTAYTGLGRNELG